MRQRVRIERPVADEGLDGAGSGTWALVQDDVAAQVQDMPIIRAAEALADGVNMAWRRSHVHLRYREDITSNMRFVMGSRIMQIIAGPQAIGHSEIIFVVEDYNPAGNPA
jgi:head-tail adaptor